MTDSADSNGASKPEAAPALMAEQSEQLRAMLVNQIAQQAQQLLALVGIGADPAQLQALAAKQLEFQAHLASQIPLTHNDEAVAAFPLFGVQLSKPNPSVLIVPGRPPPASGVAIVGPKRVRPGDPPNVIAGAIGSLAFLLQPHLRLVAHVLGIQLEFVQYPPQGGAPPKPLKWKGPAR